MSIKKLWFKISLSLALALVPAFAGASVVVILDGGGNATGTSNSIITLTGTVANTSTSTPVYLNQLGSLTLVQSGQASTTASVNSIGDTANSFALLPQILNPLQQYQGPLVKLNVMTAASPADYWANYSLLGGSASASTTLLASQNIYVHIVASSPASVSNPNPNASSTGVQLPQGLSFPGTDSGLTMSQYSNGPRLIQLEGTSINYWVSPNNIKIPMWTTAVFNSYHNNQADVATVAQDEFDYYTNVEFIRLLGNSRIYKVEGKTKRFIPSAVWNSAGIDPSQIIDINKTDFNSYKTGKNVTSVDELTPQ